MFVCRHVCVRTCVLAPEFCPLRVYLCVLVFFFFWGGGGGLRHGCSNCMAA